MKSLAANFLSLVRTHSQLKKASARRLHCNEVKASREECHNNFWSYAKGLLDSQSTCKIVPTFTASSAQSYFSDVYKSSAHQFETPSWMPIPPPPHSHTGMVMDSITQEELVKAIRKSNPSSAPSPFDRISYLIMKKCPSLQPAILNLFNSVLAEGNIPSSWKAAAVKLIPKDSAKEDPSSPGNFRPIALTPTVSKLLSTILKDRWLRHMRVNKYLNSDIQKAFLPTVPGVTEHQAKLAAIIKAARKSKRSLAVAWLDIANAYGSVHHSLIQFAMTHYHAPPEFCALFQSWYSGLSATMSSLDWVTSPIPLQIGVYQGDPLSVVIFLTVSRSWFFTSLFIHLYQPTPLC